MKILMFMLLGSGVFSESTDAFVYANRECSEYLSSNPNIYWGISLSTCKEIQAQDIELNQVYTELLRKTPRTRRNSMINSQRNWLLSRRKSCKLDERDTIVDEVDAECFLKITEDRIKYLKYR
jgi:uncharacterized protein YecT (DUF1311 family)